MNVEQIEQLILNANQGDSVAQFRLGEAYTYGHDVTVDYELAVSWYLKAASQQHPEALYNLGLCFQYGYGVKINLEKSFEYYLKSSKESFPKAFSAVGEFYFKGIFPIKNINSATTYFEKGSSLGCAKSSYYLGVIYFDGHLERDYSKAVECFLKAANNSYHPAYVYLSQIFSNGLGVAKDLEKAKYYKDLLIKRS